MVDADELTGFFSPEPISLLYCKKRQVDLAVAHIGRERGQALPDFGERVRPNAFS